eukprot:11450604-Prorocentrum_lima.AAC.1
MGARVLPTRCGQQRHWAASMRALDPHGSVLQLLKQSTLHTAHGTNAGPSPFVARTQVPVHNGRQDIT